MNNNENKEIEKIDEKDLKDLIKCGKILEKTLAFAKKNIKRDVLLLDVAEKIEEFVKKQNAKLAFPPNLSIDEIAAHYSPFTHDNTTAKGLIKVDFGVIYNGFITDAAVSIDLENNEENKKLIKASQEALKAAIKIIKPEVKVCEIGKEIEKKISEFELKPIYNLTGHNIKKNKLHGGKNIPNYDNKENNRIDENEVIAVEPFVTHKDASGYVKDGKRSSIWVLKSLKKPRLKEERMLLEHIKNNYSFFPFSQRWIEKEMKKEVQNVLSNVSTMLNFLEMQGILHNYKELIEKSLKIVSQSETTLIVKEKPVVLVDVFEI